MFISQLENSDKRRCFPFFFFYLFSFWYNYWTNNNIGKKFKYCKHRTSTKAHVARRGQKTPTQAALTAFTPPPLTSQSPSACGQTPEPPCPRCERPASSWLAFLEGESKQMRVVPTPDTNISRLNGFSCRIGEVIGNPDLHPLVSQEANIMFV